MNNKEKMAEALGQMLAEMMEELRKRPNRHAGPWPRVLYRTARRFDVPYLDGGEPRSFSEGWGQPSACYLGCCDCCPD